MNRKDILLGLEVECVWPIYVGKNLWKKKNNFQGKLVVPDEDIAIHSIKSIFTEHMNDADLSLISFKKDVTIDSFSKELPKTENYLSFLKNKVRHENQVYDLGFGLEIISEPVLVDKGLDLLEQVFDILKKVICITNETNGLHLNISYTDQKKMQLIDYCNVCQLLKQDYWLKKFNREANRYCLKSDQFEMTLSGVIEKSLENYFLKNKHERNFDFNDYPESVIGKDLLIALEDNEFIKELKAAAISKMYQNTQREGKAHCIVDRTSVSGSRYFEFRLLGGVDYEKKLKLILEALDHFIECLDSSIVGHVE